MPDLRGIAELYYLTMRQARSYQTECIEACASAMQRGERGVAFELFTGGGKGYIAAEIARRVVAKGKRMLVLVNRDNLCNQLFESITEQGMYPAMERAFDVASPFASYGKGKVSNVVVGSVQTMQGDRLNKWPLDYFDLVLTDEAQFCASDQHKATMDRFKSARHILMSATLERHDRKGLWGGAGKLERVFSMPLQAGIDDGWLVPLQIDQLPVPIDISDKVQEKKTWSAADDENFFSANSYLPKLFSEAAIRSKDRHGLAFWPGRMASFRASEAFSEMGIESRHIQGKGKLATKDGKIWFVSTQDVIDETLDWFSKPGPKVLHNSDLLSYGYDNNLIDTLLLMRLSRSLPMTKQRIGRVTRTNCNVDDYGTAEERRAAIAASVKPTALILDLMLQLGEMENRFADATELITESESDRRFVREEMKKSGKPISMADLKDKLTKKHCIDEESQLNKLAEDAANAAQKVETRIHHKDEPYYSHILNRPDGTSLPCEAWALRKLKRSGYTGPDRLTKQKCFLIQQLFNNHKAKQLEHA